MLSHKKMSNNNNNNNKKNNLMTILVWGGYEVYTKNLLGI